MGERAQPDRHDPNDAIPALAASAHDGTLVPPPVSSASLSQQAHDDGATTPSEHTTKNTSAQQEEREEEEESGSRVLRSVSSPPAPEGKRFGADWAVSPVGSYTPSPAASPAYVVVSNSRIEVR